MVEDPQHILFYNREGLIIITGTRILNGGRKTLHDSSSEWCNL